jgi:hypothetical protein
MASYLLSKFEKVGCTALSMTPLCNQLCRKFSWMILNTTGFYAGIWFGCTRHSGVIYTAVTFTAESLTALWHAQRSHWHRCYMHSGINAPLWLWTSYSSGSGFLYRKKHICIGKLTYTIYKTFTPKIRGLTKDPFLSQRCHWHRCVENRRFHSRFSPRIRSHLQKGFNLSIIGL